MMKQLAKLIFKDQLWRVALALLVLANAGFFFGILGQAITLSFFLFAPGYLLFKVIRHNIHLRWEILSFSLGLSLLFLMLVGLLLNSFHYLGLPHPLSSLPIFISLDAGVLALIYLTRHEQYHVPQVPLKGQHFSFIVSLVILPLLAIGGAMRLNNGASNILTLILFALIPCLFIFLVWKQNLKPLYPYALFMMALSILLTVSLRGWLTTGHDVQREFFVFELARQHHFWDITLFPDPYNACLSITILPTILANITHIPDVYIYKTIFQVIFAFCIVPIYFFMEKLRGPRMALMGAFLFISFPTFINDMPMLNRQEIGFIFFSLLMLLSLTDLPRRQKKLLTVLFLLGSILSHYSSSYIVLVILFASWVVYWFIAKIYKTTSTERLTLIFPTLNITIIITAILLTFLWNAQITGTTAGLKRTATKTISGIFDKAGAQSSDVGYSLFAGKQQSPQQLLSNFIKKTSASEPVHFVPTADLPLTSLGQKMNHLANVKTLNALIRNASAKFIQLMLFLGCAIIFISYYRRKLDQKDTYFLALIITCVGLLAVQTLLPQLSVDYGTLRLFQQLLIILAIPTLVGVMSLAHLFKRLRTPLLCCFLVFLFLHLSGFIPQLTGGYPPQLSLNNAGFYYEAYYIDHNEKAAANWLVDNRETSVGVAMDPYAQLRIDPDDRVNLPVASPFTNSTRAYVYKDRVNEKTGTYLININSNLYHYQVQRNNAEEDCLYSNNDSAVCKLTSK